MGTHCFINVYEDDDESPTGRAHLVTIIRTADGGQALDTVMEFEDKNTIGNGFYTGMPATEHNGAGRYALALLAAVAKGWEKYTTIAPEIDGCDIEDYLVNVFLPFEGKPRSEVVWGR